MLVVLVLVGLVLVDLVLVALKLVGFELVSQERNLYHRYKFRFKRIEPLPNEYILFQKKKDLVTMSIIGD
jgi:hypothetical protein